MDAILMELWNIILFPFEHLVFFNILLSIVVIFFQRKEPKSVWAWLLILYFIPVIGFIIYLLAGTDMNKQRMFRNKEMEEQINEAIRQQEHSIINHEMEKEYPDIKGFSDLIYYNLDTSDAVFSDDNELIVFTDGQEKFKALLADIRGAKEFIHIQYYIIRNDELFSAIKEALIQKAHDGVEVRILYDAMGCRKIGSGFWKKLEKEGIEVTAFFPALLRRLHLRINYRNHRKIVVIDDEIGYVGGFNVGREYIDRDIRFGHWRDTHFRIRGSAVDGLQSRFISDWNYARNVNLFTNKKYFIPHTTPCGTSEIQIISSGPDSVLQNIRDNYLQLISKAKKSIYIQTPYFIPDESIMSALIIAVHAGVSVNIMIPCKPDHPFVYWATYSYIGDMVMAGANCYTYNNGFLHAKGVLVDDDTFCFGTANMDIRSFRLNFEVNATVYSDPDACYMKELFIADLKYATQITKENYSRRDLSLRVREQFCRLLSPLL